MSNGELAAFGSAIQERAGIQDSPDLMCRDMLKAGRGRSDSALVKIVAEHSKETLEWTINDLGVKYKDRVDHWGGHSVARCYTPYNASGSAIIKPLLAKAKELGIEIKTGTKLTRLLTDSSGTIQGVELCQNTPQKENGTQTLKHIKARKAVVLATGGFAGDVHFRMLQDPRLTEDVEDTNRPHSSAEALIEAMRIGAKTVDLSCIQLAPWSSPDEKSFGFGALFASCAVSPYGILIDPTTGKRFVNELADRKTRADAILKIGQPCIGITDTQGLKNANYIMRNENYDIAKYIQRGVIKRFSKLEDMATVYNIPVDSLSETLRLFNLYVVNKQDLEFKKTILDGTQPIQAPYYVVRIWPKIHYTMGGLKINAKAQIVNSNDERIKRLYAAGEVTGSIHGASRLSDCATTECLVFGRIAGRHAAAEKSWH